MTHKTLEEALYDELQDHERSRIKTTLTLAPSIYDSHTQTAIVTFKPEAPQWLRNELPANSTGPGYVELFPGDDYVEIDSDFNGFTQLYPCKKEDIVMEYVSDNPHFMILSDNSSIVAVSGLNGHTFGSWCGPTGKMWLRDFLGSDSDLCKCRTFLYGYDSKIRSDGTHAISDFIEDFLTDMDTARKSKEVSLCSSENSFQINIETLEQEQQRPIVFIGHSFGGIIITQVRSVIFCYLFPFPHH